MLCVHYFKCGRWVSDNVVSQYFILFTWSNFNALCAENWRVHVLFPQGELFATCYIANSTSVCCQVELC